MRTKNPAEEFGVAQYSDGRTGREAAGKPRRVGGRGFSWSSRAGTLTRYRTDTIQPGLYNKAIHHRGQQQPLGQVGTPPPVKASARGSKTGSNQKLLDPMELL